MEERNDIQRQNRGGTEQWELIAEVTFDEPQDELNDIIFPEGYNNYLVEIYVMDTQDTLTPLTYILEKEDGSTDRTKWVYLSTQNVHLLITVDTIMLGGKPYLYAHFTKGAGINRDLNEFGFEGYIQSPLVDLSEYKRVKGIQYRKPVGIAGSYYKIYGREK